MEEVGQTIATMANNDCLRELQLFEEDTLKKAMEDCQIDEEFLNKVLEPEEYETEDHEKSFEIEPDVNDSVFEDKPAESFQGISQKIEVSTVEDLNFYRGTVDFGFNHIGNAGFLQLLRQQNIKAEEIKTENFEPLDKLEDIKPPTPAPRKLLPGKFNGHKVAKPYQGKGKLGKGKGLKDKKDKMIVEDVLQHPPSDSLSVKLLRVLIPILYVFCYKIGFKRGMWSHKPASWPDDVPHGDPTNARNGHKMNKHQLLFMYTHLYEMAVHLKEGASPTSRAHSPVGAGHQCSDAGQEMEVEPATNTADTPTKVLLVVHLKKDAQMEGQLPDLSKHVDSWMQQSNVAPIISLPSPVGAGYQCSDATQEMEVDTTTDAVQTPSTPELQREGQLPNLHSNIQFHPEQTSQTTTTRSLFQARADTREPVAALVPEHSYLQMLMGYAGPTPDWQHFPHKESAPTAEPIRTDLGFGDLLNLDPDQDAFNFV